MGIFIVGVHKPLKQSISKEINCAEEENMNMGPLNYGVCDANDLRCDFLIWMGATTSFCVDPQEIQLFASFTRENRRQN